EAGAGIGNLSAILLDCDRLVLVDHDLSYVSLLRQRFGYRDNVRVARADLTEPAALAEWRSEKIDTIVCSNVLEHLAPDEEVLSSYHDLLVPGGHCVITVPAGDWLYTGLDEELGHFR